MMAHPATGTRKLPVIGGTAPIVGMSSLFTMAQAILLL
jgi:hypothetical protein